MGTKKYLNISYTSYEINVKVATFGCWSVWSVLLRSLHCLRWTAPLQNSQAGLLYTYRRPKTGSNHSSMIIFPASLRHYLLSWSLSSHGVVHYTYTSEWVHFRVARGSSSSSSTTCEFVSQYTFILCTVGANGIIRRPAAVGHHKSSQNKNGHKLMYVIVILFSLRTYMVFRLCRLFRCILIRSIFVCPQLWEATFVKGNRTLKPIEQGV